jgi:dipeptidyl aminopeptidase/acylaminoacyl peptidase
MRKILFFLFFCNFAFAQQEKILVSDLTKIKNVVSMVASKDGSKVIYGLKTIEPTPDTPLEYDYFTHLYLIDTQNPETHKALTNGKESASQATFSADGKTIAFVRTIKDLPQIFILPLDGGEAWQLTHHKYGAGNPQFSNDQKQIIFTASIPFGDLMNDSLLNPTKSLPVWSFEKPGFKSNDFLQKKPETKPNPDGSMAEIRAYLDKDVQDKKARVLNRLNFQGEANLEPEMKFTHVFTIEINEKAKEKLITSGYKSYNNPEIANNNSIILTTQKDDNQHPDREQENIVIAIDLLTKKQSTLILKDKKNFSNITLNDGGTKMALVMNSPDLLSFGQLSTSNADGSNFKIIDFDRVPSAMAFSLDQKYLYLTANSNGGLPAYRLDLATSKIEKLTDFDSGIGSFSLLPNGKIIFAKNDISSPHEIFIADQNFQNQEKISDLNDNWLKNKKISIPEKRIYTNTKGQKVEYWIMKPTFFDANKKYPLLLQLHGGPTAMWGPGEASMWHEFQYFCAQGYGVVYPNPRGSSGYGKDFQFANYRDWGKGPQEDALAACSAAAKEAWVDTARQVITGGSYAGYLTAWIIAHDHRFKAAFAQRGVYDLTTFMGEGNAWRLLPNYFGLPWEPESITKINSNSPYSFVEKIKTPLLIKHGDNDLRTGVIQSEMMFKSLKYLEKDVEYVRLAGATHELSRTGNVRLRIDRMLRIYEFFGRYISTN